MLKKDAYVFLDEGDPSQDVTVASILFLVDGKLVFLQPSVNDDGKRKYDMRVLAQKVEYYVQLHDYSCFQPSSLRDASINENGTQEVPNHSLRDSLWIFDGTNVSAWTDIQDVLRSSLTDSPQNIPAPVQIPVDFYPVSVMLDKGILLGIDSELIQRQDIGFAFFRIATRVCHRTFPAVLSVVMY